DIHVLAVALEGEFDIVAGLLVAQGVGQSAGVEEFSFNFKNDVAGFQAGGGGGGTRIDAGDQDALAGRITQLNTEDGPAHADLEWPACSRQDGSEFQRLLPAKHFELEGGSGQL